MAKFAQYYLQYKLDDLFAQETKADRQKFFGALFEKDESIEVAVGEGVLTFGSHESHILRRRSLTSLLSCLDA